MTIPVFPETKVALKGRKGLIVGIANDQSIAWGCAKAFRALGAELAVTYLNEKAKKHVEPLAKELEAPIFMPLDVNTEGQTEQVFERIGKEWGQLDFLLHSIAFSPKEALHGRVVDVERDGFLKTMDVSCWSFMRMAHLAEPLMKNGGTLFTMTYYGSQMVVKNYNIMGVAKAGLEAAVRYIAAELGPKGIRVHAISPGPLATRAASGIPEFDELMDRAQTTAPTRSLVSIDDVGAATAFLALDGAKLIRVASCISTVDITSSIEACSSRNPYPGFVIGPGRRFISGGKLMLRQFLVGAAASGCNIAIHALVMVVVIRVARRAGELATAYQTFRLIAVMIATVTVLMIAHLAEVLVWLLIYAAVDVAPEGADLLYFAFVNYTTLGYGDVTPVKRWSLLGPMTAMNGVLLFGWSTAVIFEVLRTTLRASGEEGTQQKRGWPK